MNEKINNKLKNIFLTIICFCLVLIVQKLFFMICKYCFKFTSNIIVDPSGNIIEHFYMFLIAFIITYSIYKFKNIDFGYHLFNMKNSFKYLLFIIIIYLFFSLINAIFGIRIAIYVDLFWLIIFQLFFSGLGEEIIFRSIPIHVFDKYVKGKNINFSIMNFSIDLSMILSSLLFTIFHIAVYLNQPLYAIIYSLLYVFFGGLILSWIYRETNSIWLCMIAHGLSNVIVFIFPIISGLIYGI